MIDRRQFIWKGSVLAGAALFLRCSGICLGRVLSGRLSTVEWTALQYVAQYGHDVLISSQAHPATVAGPPHNPIRLIVRVSNLQRLRDALPNATANGIIHGPARGNMVRFLVREQPFEVENLLPDQYAKRVADLDETGHFFRRASEWS